MAISMRSGYDRAIPVFNQYGPTMDDHRRSGETAKAMTEKLTALIELARKVKMTPTEQEKQRRSFAYGNTKIENDRITRSMVDELAEAKSARHRAPG